MTIQLFLPRDSINLTYYVDQPLSEQIRNRARRTGNLVAGRARPAALARRLG